MNEKKEKKKLYDGIRYTCSYQFIFIIYLVIETGSYMYLIPTHKQCDLIIDVPGWSWFE